MPNAIFTRFRLYLGGGEECAKFEKPKQKMMIPVLIVYTFNVIGTILSCLHQKMKKSVMKCPPIQFYLYCWCHLKVSWNHQVFSSLREQNTPKKEGKIQITAFLLIASLSFFLLLIVSCLLGSQTCWWPLKSVFVCVPAPVCVSM